MQRRRMAQIAQWIGSSTSCDEVVSGVAVDSRSVVPGDLFFALPGDRVDGHDYIAMASKRGAVGAVVAASSQVESTLPLLRVADPLVALQEAAICYRREVSTAPIAAITGSVGKTTVKEFTATLLSQKYRLLATPGNRNSQIGLPLTLFDLTGDEEWLVLEMSLSGVGHIARLVEIAPPTIALLTGVSLTHAQFFTDINAIAVAKGEIFSHPKTELGLLPSDLFFLESIGSCRKAPLSLDCALEKGRLVLFQEGKRVVEVPWHLPGEHNRRNFCMAAQLAQAAGLEWEEIAAGAAYLKLPPMRFQTVVKRGVTLINDAYNACQASMEAALASLPEVEGRRVALLGEMGELGRYSEECHRRVGEVALGAVDELICYGEGAQPMVDVWQEAGRDVAHFTERKELLAHLRERAQGGDLVLVKGSRSCGLDLVVDGF